MTKATLLAGTALTMLLAGGLPALAASVDIDGTVITLGADDTATSTNRNDPPYRVNADGVAINNAGRIENSDTRNNTNAIEVYGDNLTVTNSGTIQSGDRAIHTPDDSLAGGLTVVNEAGGEIRSRRQTIRSQENNPGATVINHGTIYSEEGRALQLRGTGATVINHGTLNGGEEVIEGRLDFTLENYGEIVLHNVVAEDDDGVQFASGRVDNHGRIQGNDDGVDADEGVIHNRAGGRIISVHAADSRDSGGIDADALLQDPAIAEADQAQAGLLRIVNEGLIEGPRAITTAEGRTGAIEIVNSGRLVSSFGSVAIDLVPEVSAASLTLLGGSQITGDVLFGNGTNEVVFGALSADAWIDGSFLGGSGIDRVIFDIGSYALSDLTFSMLGLNKVEVSFDLPESVFFSATFLDFDFWNVGGVTYKMDANGTLSPVPLPAGLPLLLAAMGGLVLVGRRKAA